MTFAAELDGFDFSAMARRIASADASAVERALNRPHRTIDDFAVLLSKAAEGYLEPMAQQARALTRSHFGNAVVLFTPLYISNYCDNGCRYCSFACQHQIGRHQLGPREIERECESISASGIRHILVLTGESRTHSTPDYLAESISVIAPHFSSVAIEVYPLQEQEYGRLIGLGVDALTLYQEVYDKERYRVLHPFGPKKDYLFRLETPERACRQNIRALTIGALLGLGDVHYEALCTALHLSYLHRNFPAVELSVSLPRLRPLVATFDDCTPVGDRAFVQILLAFRLVFPHIGITISTRESQQFRDNLLPLGVTKMSAGVSTAVGGHSSEDSVAQFEIDDTRSVEQVSSDLQRLGYQPVLHDWNHRLTA
jgi:2-iminoacetate synthase